MSEQTSLVHPELAGVATAFLNDSELLLVHQRVVPGCRPGSALRQEGHRRWLRRGVGDHRQREASMMTTLDHDGDLGV
jgi:hypothetical protein